MKELLSLFLTFLKIGAFTFGGGYAMIPLIQHEMVEKKKWLTSEEMVDIIAIAESTPGVLAVNTATFVGYKIKKFWGSFFA
ncbi:MAG TPA: chromate transporter, partial [Bacilli bacterium]|nr:chromate transporter [Bacilli bacterium]